MVELKYIGTHQPKGMIIDVEVEQIEKFLKKGEYEEVVKKSKTKIIKEEVVLDDSKRIKE